MAPYPQSKPSSAADKDGQKSLDKIATPFSLTFLAVFFIMLICLALAPKIRTRRQQRQGRQRCENRLARRFWNMRPFPFPRFSGQRTNNRSSFAEAGITIPLQAMIHQPAPSTTSLRASRRPRRERHAATAESELQTASAPAHSTTSLRTSSRPHRNRHTAVAEPELQTASTPATTLQRQPRVRTRGRATRTGLTRPTVFQPTMDGVETWLNNPQLFAELGDRGWLEGIELPDYARYAMDPVYNPSDSMAGNRRRADTEPPSYSSTSPSQRHSEDSGFRDVDPQFDVVFNGEYEYYVTHNGTVHRIPGDEDIWL